MARRGWQRATASRSYRLTSEEWPSLPVACLLGAPALPPVSRLRARRWLGAAGAGLGVRAVLRATACARASVCVCAQPARGARPPGPSRPPPAAACLVSPVLAAAALQPPYPALCSLRSAPGARPAPLGRHSISPKFPPRRQLGEKRATQGDGLLERSLEVALLPAPLRFVLPRLIRAESRFSQGEVRGGLSRTRERSGHS